MVDFVYGLGPLNGMESDIDIVFSLDMEGGESMFDGQGIVEGLSRFT